MRTSASLRIASTLASALLAANVQAGEGTAPSTPSMPAAPAAPAARIVALQPSMVEAVCVLGACERLVGVSRHANWPESVGQLPRVGGMADADVEAIVALQPDLVLLGSRSRAADRLRALGLRVLVLDARSHADIQRNLEAIAQAIGRPGAGQALWQRINARLHALSAQVPPEWRGRRVYLELHGGHAAAGAASFIGETLTRLGLANVVPVQMGAFPKLAPEYVLRADPDLLITAKASVAPPPATRPGWHSLRAVRDKRHCAIDNSAFEIMLRPGPRIDEAAASILQCLRGLDAPG
ncbi:MAG: helical backbone metal receptor [Pseudomonadota bacterium]|nr:helical backbone metal receptor [Pseudomonadota bacterium]